MNKLYITLKIRNMKREPHKYMKLLKNVSSFGMLLHVVNVDGFFFKMDPENKVI